MKSVLNSIGSKAELDINKYIDSNNLDIDTYCEPFSGGFGAGIKLLENGFKGKVILNDLDKEIYNFWRVLQTDWEKLVDSIDKLLYELDKYEYLDDRLNIIYGWKKSDDNIKNASAEYLYKKMQSINGMKMSTKLKIDSEIDFFLHNKYLQNVVIENKDYKDILSKYDSVKTFMLIDPPYFVTRVGNYYRCESEFFYHRGLRESLEGLKSKMIVTYNDSEYLKDLYKGFKVEYIERHFVNTYYELYFRNF